MASVSTSDREKPNTETPTTALRERFCAFLEGDDEAFAEIYRELNPRLSAYCYKLIPEEAPDVMQQLWERVITLRKKHALTDEAIASPIAYLIRTVRNLAADFHRRSVDVRELRDEDEVGNPAIPHQANPTDLECVVLDALEKLSFDDREVLVLNIYSGYSFGEIAEMMGKSVDAIWARASRARIRLREIVVADARRLGVALPSKPIPTTRASRRSTDRTSIPIVHKEELNH